MISCILWCLFIKNDFLPHVGFASGFLIFTNEKLPPFPLLQCSSSFVELISSFPSKQQNVSLIKVVFDILWIFLYNLFIRILAVPWSVKQSSAPITSTYVGGHSLLPPDCSKLFLRIFFAGFLIFSSWKREAGSGVNSCSKYWVVHFPFELKVSIHWKELQASRGRYHLLFWQNPASKKGCGSDPYALSCNWRIEHHKGLSLCPACPVDSSSSQLILSSSMATRPVDRLSNSGQLTSKGLLMQTKLVTVEVFHCLSFFYFVTSACCTEVLCVSIQLDLYAWYTMGRIYPKCSHILRYISPSCQSSTLNGTHHYLFNSYVCPQACPKSWTAYNFLVTFIDKFVVYPWEVELKTYHLLLIQTCWLRVVNMSSCSKNG